MRDPIDPVWGFKLSERELSEFQAADGRVASSLPALKPLEKMASLSEEDMQCFAELKEVLRRHKKLDRFGVTLLHSHFAMGPGEVLVESSDAQRRTMTLEPKIMDTTEIDAIDTQWYLGNAMPLSLVKCRTSLHIEK
ncbi:hypothetical protein QA639_28745 [Bradyrhizobium pachyrhizi]|uniref:hypothetical protein n=1 Tax=Bradyrhizobium pachyrhizi TaxID=280333 RepID=UPI0024B23713|nr:hypothetical protein [Bradyrhizobium pachyrhizi]WFU53630.1 hypothetical protein QA639_28745 [Bradyrhizobium pachyrhizi]